MGKDTNCARSGQSEHPQLPTVTPRRASESQVDRISSRVTWASWVCTFTAIVGEACIHSGTAVVLTEGDGTGVCTDLARMPAVITVTAAATVCPVANVSTSLDPGLFILREVRIIKAVSRIKLLLLLAARQP